MLHRLSRLVGRFASHKSLIISLALVFLLLGFLNLVDSPVSVLRSKQYTNGSGHLDIQLSYNAMEAYTTLETMGADGRRAYLGFLLTADLLLPLAFAMLLSTMVTLSFRITFKGRWRLLQRLNLVPWLGALFDLAENGSILWLLARYPDRYETVATVASVFTQLKRAGYGVGLLLVFVGLGGVLAYRWGRSRVKSGAYRNPPNEADVTGCPEVARRNRFKGPISTR